MPQKNGFHGKRRSKRLAAWSLVTAVAVTSLGLGATPAMAVSGATPSYESALHDFRSSLVEGSQTDPSAAADIERFDNLSNSQRQELARYLTGELEVVTPIAQSPQLGDGTSTTIREGNFTWKTVEKSATGEDLLALQPVSGKGQFSTTATTTVKSIWATQYFTFAGIKISETKVSGSYNVRSSRATGIRSHTCNVVRNYDPFSGVSTSKNASYVSGGRAVFECLVSVKRGVPTPWGHISYSTRENVQYARGTGAGRVDAHGWR